MTRNKRNTLPDLSEISGELDEYGQPLLRRELSDAPSPERMAVMRDRIIQQIDAIPANAQSGADWSEPNKWGISNDDLYGPYDSRGLDPEQKKLAYDAAMYGRSKSDGVETLEHGHVLGDSGLSGLSQADLDALDARDQHIAQDAASLWTDFQERWPDLAQDPQLVAEAIAVTNQEIADFGDNPAAVSKHDRANYLKHVAQNARNGSTTRQNRETYREYGIEPEDGRSTSLSYGEGVRGSEPDKKADDGDMIKDLQNFQRRSGLW